MVYFKERQTFKTYRMAQENDYSVCLESYDGDNSTLTVAYKDAGQKDVGAWLVWDGKLFVVNEVKPADDKTRTTLTLTEPASVFDRDVIYASSYSSLDTGAFLAAVINAEFVNQSDTFYALPLTVRSNVPLAQTPPCEVGDIFNVYDYLLSLRQSNDVFTDFRFSGEAITVDINVRVPETFNVFLGDGHSILKSQDFGSADSVAKVTTINGNTKQDWYLDVNGAIQSTPPTPRVQGSWKLVTLSSGDDAEQKAREAFGRTSGAHNVQFKTGREFAVGDVVNLRIDDTTVTGRISSKSLDFGENWYLYKTGNLAVKLTDKIKRMVSK